MGAVAARIALAAMLAAVLAAVGTGALPGGLGHSARADEYTASQDMLRTGWDPNEAGLSPGTVSGAGFGQLFSTPVSGQVYAQPLVVGQSLIVATENNWIYSLNAVTGAVNWSVSLGPDWPSSELGCGDLTPNIGVTGTPVYDPATGTVYLVAVVNDGPNTAQPHIYTFALSATTGAVQWKLPVQGSPSNDPSRPFNPLTERQRPGLLLMGGSLYMAFGSYCDYNPYVGYVVGVNTSTKALTMWSDEAGVTDNQGGIWQGGGGVMSDGAGRIFVGIGNGVSPAPGPGTSPPGQLGDSVARLAVGSDGSLAAQDFFSPANAPTLDVNDQDFGSGGPVGLPFGTSTYPHLLVQAGKDGRLFLLNRDSLGGRETGTGHTDNPVSMSGPYEGEWGHPAAFGGGSSGYVYYTGTGGPLRALQFNGSSTAHPVLTDAANSTSTFGYTSGSPVVTSNGSDPASAVVWEVYSPTETGANGKLEAFDAVPQKVGSTTEMKEIWSAPIGTAPKFAIPATSNGRVYIGTRDGHVLGFGPGSPLSGTAVSFGPVAAGSTRNGTATLTLSRTETQSVTISSITTSAPFTASPTQTPPVTLSPGQSITVPVTFSPAGPGGATGSLSFATNLPEFPTVSISLSGDGTKPGFYASPGTLPFGTVATGSSEPLPVDIINGGTSAETVSKISQPGGPFSVTGLPAPTTSIPAGGSVPATVTYKPTAAENDTGTLTVTGPDGAATVALSGTGVAGQGTLSASPATVSFGSVPLGQSPTQTVDVTNSGNLPVTITGAAAPTAPFGLPEPVSAGLTLDPGYDLQVPVTFTPTSAGTVTGTYRLTASDGHNAPQTLVVAVSGTGTAPASGVAVPGPGGGWTLNGSARMSGTSLDLTQAVTSQTGSAVYYQPVPSDGLHAQFTAQISGGNGADGMTFALLDPAAATPSSIGAGGGGLGFGKLPGVAVTLDTFKDTGYPSANFAGIATGTGAGGLAFAATSSSVPSLRSGSHTIGVTSSGGTLTVTIDGKQYLSAPVNLPPTVLVGFTGATGGLDDVHAVRNATISAGGTSLPPPGGGWSYNGSAAMSGSGTAVTQAVKSQSGSVVYPTPVLTNGLHAQFNVQIGGGTGADGVTFSLLDPARATPTALGGGGSGLGYSGLPGIAVTLNTYKDAGYPTNNFIGISASATNGLLTFQATAHGIGQLRSGTHTVGVDVSGGVLSVWLDGQQILARAESLPATSLLAFTASTGGLTDIHAVRDAAISAASYALTPPGGTGWTYNGSAKMNGTSLVLNPAAAGQHGSAFNGTAVPSGGLSASFTAQIGSGNGNGMALVLLDASKAGPGSIGTAGSGLGYAGLPGIAVTLNTYKSIGYPSANFVGIATGANNGLLTFAATSSQVPSLHGTNTIRVTVSATGEVKASVNGTQVLDATVPVPQNVLVGFTSGTGAAYEQHAVAKVTVTP
jgi:hypothetical protein